MNMPEKDKDTGLNVKQRDYSRLCLAMYIEKGNLKGGFEFNFVHI